jgi:hypothetical protein
MKVAAVITNLSILLLFVVAALLNEYSEALFYLSVQEDELLEWATFWGFMVAAAIYFSSAYRQFKAEPRENDIRNLDQHPRGGQVRDGNSQDIATF